MQGLEITEFPMRKTIAGLIADLHRFNTDFSAEDMADVLWCAALQFADVRPAPPMIEKEHSPPPKKMPSDSFRSEKISDDLKSDQEPRTDVYPSALQSENASATRLQNGLPLPAPGVHALPHARRIVRALRPLIRYIPSPDSVVLDEENTAQRIAQSNLWLPEVKPKPMRWLELVLVVEDSPSMCFWHHTIKELRQLLEQQGAFRYMQTWTLKTDGKTREVNLYAEGGKIPRHPKELINSARQRLVLIATDCVSPAWRGEKLIAWLNIWGRRHPVTLLQLLPQNMWQKTGLRTAHSVKVTAPCPVAPNHYLRWQRDDFVLFSGNPDELEGPRKRMPILLVTLETNFLAGWAKFIAGAGDIRLPAFIFTQAKSEPKQTPLSEIDEDARLYRFRSLASPIAYKLACCLAAAPLRLPIMRLVQQVMLPESLQTHLAEVFLSGLIQRLTPKNEIIDPDEVNYDFIGGIRDKLLNAGLITNALEVQLAVSEYITKRYGSALNFRSVIAYPEDGHIQFPFGQEGFAKITAQVLEKLGGKYSEVAGQLREKFVGNGLIALLLECPSIRNPQSRHALLREMPPYITSSIEEGNTSFVHVLNIVNACMNYADGFKQFLEILQHFDGETKQFQKLTKFMSEIMPAVYKTGGPLDKEDATYIERKADYEVLMHLKVRDFTMFIGSHQQGKTSLINHISDHPLLSDYNFLSINCISLDLKSEHGWYQSVGKRLLDQLGKWDKYHIIPLPENSYGWRNFLSELGKQAQQNNQWVVIALDEISAVPSKYSDGFFSILREIYDAAQNEREFQCITFILAGTYNPADLIKNEAVSPFNIAHRVHLADFSLEEVRKLVHKGGWSDEQAERLAKHIHHWTDGQPYLSQLLCSYLELNATPSDVDKSVERLLRTDENHLKPLHKRLESDQKSYEYAGRILYGEKIKFYPVQTPPQAELELMGIIKADADGDCMIRNRIYKRSLKLFYAQRLDQERTQVFSRKKEITAGESVKRLKGMVPRPAKPVSLEKMEEAIQHEGSRL